jgi:hypothetical protein
MNPALGQHSFHTAGKGHALAQPAIISLHFYLLKVCPSSLLQAKAFISLITVPVLHLGFLAK